MYIYDIVYLCAGLCTCVRTVTVILCHSYYMYIYRHTDRVHAGTHNPCMHSLLMFMVIVDFPYCTHTVRQFMISHMHDEGRPGV